jgi:hypothetical protein
VIGLPSNLRSTWIEGPMLDFLAAGPPYLDFFNMGTRFGVFPQFRGVSIGRSDGYVDRCGEGSRILRNLETRVYISKKIYNETHRITGAAPAN